MTGVPRHIAEHRLNVSENAKPVVHAKRHLGDIKHDAMQEQVTDLLNAGIIREVRYQTWVASPVMVLKPNGSWRICVDYKDLNKACPRDCYALPDIDEKIDSLATFRWKCFLNCYKGYHQVQMAIQDEDKTAFRTPTGLYCYTKMSFGLKNAGATYQRLMNETFSDAIGKYIEVYMDDLVIMSKEESMMLVNIQKTFNTLRGVQAIERMPSPSTIKEMQKLAGRLAALNRFLANHATKSFPFIKTLRNCMKKSQFQWTPEAESALREMKECLIRLPTLTAPVKGEPLVLYLSASDKAVGVVLLVDRQGVQTPVYYVSRTLTDPETRYFANHVIHVLTNYNIGNILARPEISGRLAKWAIELGGHNVVFRPRPAIKGQVLADFMTEVPDDKDRECKALEKAERQYTEEPWLLYTDGASNEDGAGAGLRLVSPDKHEFTYAIWLDFKSTNNEAEYEAFLAGLRLAIKMGVKHIEAHVDSMLVVGQINGQYDAKGDVMALYLNQAKTLLQNFYSYKNESVEMLKERFYELIIKLEKQRIWHSNDERISKFVDALPLEWDKFVNKEKRNSSLSHYDLRSFINTITNHRCHEDSRKRKLLDEIRGELVKIDLDVIIEMRKRITVCLAAKNDMIYDIKRGTYKMETKKEADVEKMNEKCSKCEKSEADNALASTTSTVVRRFIWEQIICRFGLPLRIVTDNGTNFAADNLQRWFKELHIEHTFSSVAHPQGNGQVEAVNKSIVDGIKARLGTQRRGWVDELLSILWAHRTMPKISNGETPFSLVYGSEVMIPVEIGLPSPRMLSMNMINNEEERRLDLDLL
ncbi:uncharacterized protein LOC110945054 [Helianthus annuus]|uniref:uncharacterized protein LOC110945054 n=1 Tax=Helianthus annuus TaxID=4232 RepID=UPI0016531A33|nr:uncharacterized protein LOC110945054 [Helianthus annuus]